MTKFYEIKRLKAVTAELRDKLTEQFRIYNESQGYPELDNDEAYEKMAAYVVRPNATLVVIFNEKKGGVIGYMLLYHYREAERKVATIKEFLLVPKARRQGIPRLMLREVINWAEAENCDAIEVGLKRESQPENQGLMNLLKTAGFREISVQYSLDLSEADLSESGESNG